MSCRRCLHVVLVALAATSQLAPACRGDARPAAGPGFDTPEACLAAMQQAARAKDVGALCDGMTADSHRALAGYLIDVGNRFKLLAETNAYDRPDAAEAHHAVVDLMHRHHLTRDAMQRLAAHLAQTTKPAVVLQLVDAVPDARAFIADMFDMFAAMMKPGEENQFSMFVLEMYGILAFFDQFEGQLQNVEIRGDEATAVLITPTGPAPLSLAFRRSAGQGWKFDMSLEALIAKNNDVFQY